MALRFAIDVPNFDEFGDPLVLVDLAVRAEAAGWDGFFIWDHLVWSREPVRRVADPWVVLAAVAQATSRLTLGPLVTPLARRRPAKVARETVTLDHLSGGRLVLGVGLGEPSDEDFAALGDAGEPRVKAARLDEALTLIDRMWSGRQVTHAGAHFTVENLTFLPTPLQQPRIPVWVAGVWPNTAPLARARRWDGYAPLLMEDGRFAKFTPAQVGEMRAVLPPLPFDLAVFGTTEVADPPAMDGYADAGLTWWCESFDPWRGTMDEQIRRIDAGPPRTSP